LITGTHACFVVDNDWSDSVPCMNYAKLQIANCPI